MQRPFRLAGTGVLNAADLRYVRAPITASLILNLGDAPVYGRATAAIIRVVIVLHYERVGAGPNMSFRRHYAIIINRDRKGTPGFEA